jgi:(p)ppGpp synthase/HD superfamily hydrolase
MLGQRDTPSFVEGLPKARAAVAYAQHAHKGQVRKSDGSPFVAHPLEVASLLYHAGAPDHVIAAGVLHDVIEKTDSSAADLRSRFGTPVAELVVAVTEDERIRIYAERKAALRDQAARAGEDALMVFAADKLSKAREFRLHPQTARHRRRRLAHYRDCLRLLDERMPASPLVRGLASELQALGGSLREPQLAGAR